MVEHKNPNTGEVSFVTMEFSDGTNDSRWYDWNIANWDTKWDIAGSVEIEEQDSEIVEINFNASIDFQIQSDMHTKLI